MNGTLTGAARWPHSPIAEGQICAGFDAGTVKRDSCSGDSGGPLNAYDSRGCPTQVGIVSWGAEDCGALKAYGIYTRISHHAAWLRAHVPALANAPAGQPPAGNGLAAADFVAQLNVLIRAARGDVRIGIKPTGTIKLGGSFTFECAAPSRGRLVIVDVNADGVTSQIFPNEYVAREDLSLVRAGQVVAGRATASTTFAPHHRWARASRLRSSCRRTSRGNVLNRAGALQGLCPRALRDGLLHEHTAADRLSARDSALD